MHATGPQFKEAWIFAPLNFWLHGVSTINTSSAVLNYWQNCATRLSVAVQTWLWSFICACCWLSWGSPRTLNTQVRTHVRKVQQTIERKAVLESDFGWLANALGCDAHVFTSQHFMLTTNLFLQISQDATTHMECVSIIKTLVHQIYRMNATITTTARYLQTNAAVVNAHQLSTL